MQRNRSGFVLRLPQWLRRGFPGRRTAPRGAPPEPKPKTIVVLLDGTMSSLQPGFETNIGLTFKLLEELERRPDLEYYYEPGIQWRGWRYAHEVIAGIGINRQIRRAYRFLAKTYAPGDRIILMGFSRGAYAVRSLAGLMDRIGLLKKTHATPAEIERVYALYRSDPGGAAAASVGHDLCHEGLSISFMGVYDTVRALGVRWPVLWRFTGEPHPYHTHTLGDIIQVGRQALALNETRDAYTPVLWDVTAADHCAEGVCDIEQMWFRGTHGDIGGQLGGRDPARPLSHIPLVWMLGEAQVSGLPLPDGWRARFPLDQDAPSIGPFAGWSKLFLDRSRRKLGQDPSEKIHPSVTSLATRDRFRAAVAARRHLAE